jgi:uncharacterized membrane protein (DUF4010 family)
LFRLVDPAGKAPHQPAEVNYAEWGGVEAIAIGSVALLAPLLAGAVLLLLAGLRAWRGVSLSDAPPAPSELPPFDLGTALGFGLYLGLTAVLLRAGRDWLGEGSVVLLSGLSGLADMDAVAITLARLTTSANHLATDLAVWAFGAAVLANMATKAAMAWTAGGPALGRRILAGHGLALLTGALAAWIAG